MYQANITNIIILQNQLIWEKKEREKHQLKQMNGILVHKVLAFYAAHIR